MSDLLRREALPIKVLLAQQGRPHRDVAGVIANLTRPCPMPNAGETRKAGHIHTRAYRGSLGGYRREKNGLAARLVRVPAASTNLA